MDQRTGERGGTCHPLIDHATGQVPGAGVDPVHRECARRLAAVQEQLDHLQALLARAGVLPPAAQDVRAGLAGSGAPLAARAAGPVRTSRRGLLGAGAAALGGLAAGQLLTPPPASAATGGPVVLGRANTAGATTSIAGPGGAPALTLLGGADDNGFNQQALEAQGNVSVHQRPAGTGLLVEGGGPWEYSSGTGEAGSGAQPGTTMVVHGALFSSASFSHWSESTSETGAIGLEVTARANTAISAYAANGTSTSDDYEDGSGPTTRTIPGTALEVDTDDGGTGIRVRNGGIDVARGRTLLNDGLEVRAGGVAVTGSTVQDGITSTADGAGRAVYGLAASATSTSGAVTGEHRGKGAGVWGHQASASPAAEAAVVGYSVNGRGARFRGALAQVQLTPAAAAAPPAGGVAGDVLVDRGNRLWFCRSTSATAADWQQVQVGPVRRVVRVTAAATAAAGDVVPADTTATALTVTLPAPGPGVQVSVKKVDAGARAVTVRAAGNALVDGAASRTLNTRWQSLNLVGDGRDWFVL
ncbi:hypothetical protein [Kineococcus sp. SYSU DK005]|uniref:hypothetical protein n=1 Tax=Kineococcus sp. SYSU DK005 TaxID=3383126 RepID=UPI003D7E7CF0